MRLGQRRVLGIAALVLGIGAALLATCRGGGDAALALVVADGNLAIGTTDGREPRPLTTDRGVRLARWSPSGRQIALARDRQVDLLNADGGGRRTLAQASEVRSLAWSPDGAWLLFADRDTWQIVPAAGGEPRTLGRGPNALWARRGDRLLLASPTATQGVPGRAGSLTLTTLRVDGSDPRPVFTGLVRAMAWAPDGEQLVLALADEPTQGGARSKLRVVRWDGSGGRDLLQGGIVGLSPWAWSADGGRILFLREEANQKLTAWVIESGGGGARAVGAPGEDAYWSPRGDRLLLADEQGTLALAQPDGSDRRPLATGASLTSEQPWSPDGRWVAYRAGQGNSLFGVPVAGGELRPIGSGELALWLPAPPAEPGPPWPWLLAIPALALALLAGWWAGRHRLRRVRKSLPAAPATVPPPPRILCRQCGGRNSAGQSACRRCGTPLGVLP